MWLGENKLLTVGIIDGLLFGFYTYPEQDTDGDDLDSYVLAIFFVYVRLQVW
jgi:hypothetical protein